MIRGALNGRGLCGCLMRKVMTQAHTNTNAISVPMLTNFTAEFKGTKPANSAIIIAEMNRFLVGTPFFVERLENNVGNKPSRDIAKDMRVNPYKKAKSTVVILIIAPAPIMEATHGKCKLSKALETGEALFRV